MDKKLTKLLYESKRLTSSKNLEEYNIEPNKIILFFISFLKSVPMLLLYIGFDFLIYVYVELQKDIQEPLHFNLLLNVVIIMIFSLITIIYYFSKELKENHSTCYKKRNQEIYY